MKTREGRLGGEILKCGGRHAMIMMSEAAVHRPSIGMGPHLPLSLSNKRSAKVGESCDGCHMRA